MHEASLAGSVLRIVEQAAAREGFARVLRLRLAEGPLPALGAACAACGAWALRPTAGLDLRVVDLQVCDDAT